MIRLCQNDLVAIWLGLFAMLMIHIGPLISGAQALANPPAFSAAAHTQTAHHQSELHSHVLTAELSKLAPVGVESSVDYHALMGHHAAPAGLPQWLVNLEMCGYCELLTISPPLLLTLLLLLPVVPCVPAFAALPQSPKYLAVARSLSLPRAPPAPFFT